MKQPFKIRDHVNWKSEAGHVSEKIIKIHIAGFYYKCYMHHATEEDSLYAIQGDKTDHVAVHKEKELTKS